MIFYFSGTGNSRYVAEELADALDSDLRFIPRVSPNILAADTVGEYGVGFVFPVYSWGVPPIVLDFISRIKDDTIAELIEKKVNIWVVMTCGDEVARAPEMIEESLRRKGLSMKGVWSVIMPNNYVLLPGFGVDPKDIEEKKLSDAPLRIREVSDHIKARQWRHDVTIGKSPDLKTKLVYPLFKRWGVFPKKWKFTDDCISCGKCEKICPVGNIKLHDGKPVWGKECISCVACYHICPKNAIQYGSFTKGKGQYFCPKNKLR